MQIYCPKSDDYIDDIDAISVFDALVQVTGHDSFALSPDRLEAMFGDDFEHCVTQEMMADAGRIAHKQWWYVREIMLERCCEYQLDGGNVFDASVEL